MAKPMPPRGDACEMARVTTLCDKLSTLSGKRNPGRKGPLVNTWGLDDEKVHKRPFDTGPPSWGPLEGRDRGGARKCPPGRWKCIMIIAFPHKGRQAWLTPRGAPRPG